MIAPPPPSAATFRDTEPGTPAHGPGSGASTPDEHTPIRARDYLYAAVGMGSREPSTSREPSMSREPPSRKARKGAPRRLDGRRRLDPIATLVNTGSVARDHLASERTFLAYVRTSLAIASMGVGAFLSVVALFVVSGG